MFWLMPHLTSCPAQNLRGGAGEVAVDARRQTPVRPRLVAAEEMLIEMVAGGVMNRRLTPLFARIGRARTHLAHCAPDGSFARGGTVRKQLAQTWRGRAPASSRRRSPRATATTAISIARITCERFIPGAYGPGRLSGGRYRMYRRIDDPDRPNRLGSAEADQQAVVGHRRRARQEDHDAAGRRGDGFQRPRSIEAADRADQLTLG